MMFQRRFISCNKCSTLVENFDNGEAMHMRVYGEDFNFARSLPAIKRLLQSRIGVRLRSASW